jgi:hypothetical protein
MRTNMLVLATTIIMGGGLATAIAGSPVQTGRSTSYEVTVTNVTRGQIMSPPIVVVHDPAIKLFEVGQPASDELAAVAEDADATGMLAYLAGMMGNGVDDYAIADDVVMPGQSVTLQVDAQRGCRVLSLVSMLVTTNDGFVGIDSTPLNGCGTVITPSARHGIAIAATAYDAGSEANTESCEHIPGPPCGSHFVRVTDGAEGYVHVHAGIHGIGDLTPAMHDWRNPAAEVWINRR